MVCYSTWITLNVTRLQDEVPAIEVNGAVRWNCSTDCKHQMLAAYVLTHVKVLGFKLLTQVAEV